MARPAAGGKRPAFRPYLDRFSPCSFGAARSLIPILGMGPMACQILCVQARVGHRIPTQLLGNRCRDRTSRHHVSQIPDAAFQWRHGRGDTPRCTEHWVTEFPVAHPHGWVPPTVVGTHGAPRIGCSKGAPVSATNWGRQTLRPRKVLTITTRRR